LSVFVIFVLGSKNLGFGGFDIIKFFGSLDFFFQLFDFEFSSFFANFSFQKLIHGFNGSSGV
jgi:hypothetical protein